MSQSIDKLKQLLFDSETQTLATLAHRVETLALDNQDLREELLQLLNDLEGRGEEGRQTLSERIEAIHARAGSDELMTRSVAEVLDRAFTQAERSRHAELAGAVAPVVVRTVKTEITNSREELVEALYPMTGQMVKSYVASAMRDLVNQINRRLEQNALMLRLRSWSTGRSMAELAIADSQQLAVEELLLIRRGTGELISRWPERSPGNYDHVFGGVLTAINTFATEALDGGESTLRKIDLGDTQVYLRASPSLLLAARCSGTASSSIEAIIDEEFLATVDQFNAQAATGKATTMAGDLGTTAETLGVRITSKQAELAAPALGVSPVKLLAWLIGTPLTMWLAWTVYVTTQTKRVESTAADIIRTSPEIQGYPSTIDVAPRGVTLRITGLAPSDDAVASVLGRLRDALPRTRIVSQLAVVPNAGADAVPQIAVLRKELDRVRADLPRQIAARELSRARMSLATATAEFGALQKLMKPDAKAPATIVKSMIASLEEAGPRIDALGAALAAGPPGPEAGDAMRIELDKRAGEIATQAMRLTRELGGAPRERPSTLKPSETPDGYAAAAERLAGELQEVATVAVALVQAAVTRAAIPPPVPPPEPVVLKAEPTPLELLSRFVRANAIFFADRTDYRDDATTEATLDRLAELARPTRSLIRIVGYTDERGSTRRNSKLSQERAERVRNALLARGMEPDRLIAVGRQDARDISPTTGPTSPNRRVEFELGFEGEDLK